MGRRCRHIVFGSAVQLAPVTKYPLKPSEFFEANLAEPVGVRAHFGEPVKDKPGRSQLVARDEFRLVPRSVLGCHVPAFSDAFWLGTQSAAVIRFDRSILLGCHDGLEPELEIAAAKRQPLPLWAERD